MWNRIEVSMEGAHSQPGCTKVNGKSAIYSIKPVVGGSSHWGWQYLITTGSAAMVQVRRGDARWGGGEAENHSLSRDDTALTRRYCFQLKALLRGSQTAEMNKSFHLWKHSAAEQLLPEVKCFHCNVPFQNGKLLTLTSGYLYQRTQLWLHLRQWTQFLMNTLPKPPIQSPRNIPFPKICGEAREKMQELSETLRVRPTEWNRQKSHCFKTGKFLNCTHQPITQMERGENRKGLK